MPISLAQFMMWVFIGLLAGSLAGLVVKRRRKGFGVPVNFGLAWPRALVGELSFRLLGLFPQLDQLGCFPLRDVVAAVLGWTAGAQRSCGFCVVELELC